MKYVLITVEEVLVEFIFYDAVSVTLFLLVNHLFDRYIVKNNRNPKSKIYISHPDSATFYSACLILRINMMTNIFSTKEYVVKLK